MIDWLQNKPYAFRVFLLTGSALAGLLAIIISYLTVTASVDEKRVQAEIYSRISLLGKNIENKSLQIRRREKDFLLRRDLTYADRYMSDMEDAQALLTELSSYDMGRHVKQAISNLQTILPKHQIQFELVRDNISDLGFDENSGLQASLRAAVHNIEESLTGKGDVVLENLMLMMRRHEKDFIMRVDAKYVTSIETRSAEFRQALLKSPFSDSVKKDILDKLSLYTNTFNTYADLRLTLDGNISRLSNIYSATADHFATIYNAAEQGQIQATQQAEEANRAGFITIIACAAVIFVLVAFVSWVLIKTTVGPVRKLERALGQIAGGDYSVDIPGTQFKDEFGRMARVSAELRDSAAERVQLEKEAREKSELQAKQDAEHAAALAEAERATHEREQQEATRREERAQKVAKLIEAFDAQISTAVENLDSSSSGMKNTASEMVEIAELTGKQVQSVSDASGEMDGNVSSMAAAIEEFATSISEVNQQMQMANDTSQKATTASGEGTIAIGKLADTSKQIEDVVRLINDIAEQTNLLALNATIEAARAGDAGKGFAVVASEVKSLANQTAQATDNITKQIADMQQVTGTTVSVMETIGEMNEQLNHVMTSIASAVEEQEVTTQEISRSVQYAAESTQKVASDIHEVSQGAQKTGVASGVVMTEADRLAALSRDIRFGVDEFLEDVRTI